MLLALHGGMRSHGALSRELMVSTGAMTNRLDKLERGGLVRRERDPEDRRGVLLALTDDGRERLTTAVDLAAADERDLLGALNVERARSAQQAAREAARRAPVRARSGAEARAVG